MLKKARHRKLLITGVLTIGIIAIATSSGKASFTDPGSKDDPIVSRSYVEGRIDQVKLYIDQKIKSVVEVSEANKVKIAKLEERSGQFNNETKGESRFQALTLQAGQKLIGIEGTEIIVRGGRVRAVVPESAGGGLVAINTPLDIKNNEIVPINNLILISRNDGRGISAEIKSYFLVKGGYRIE